MATLYNLHALVASVSIPLAMCGVERMHADALFRFASQCCCDCCSVAIECRTTSKESQGVTIKRYLLSSSEARDVSIGSAAENQVVLTDPNISATHARVR